MAKNDPASRKPFGAKEGIGLEFKRATDTLPANFFDTVCAFLNMDGGQIILGVEDDGTVSGVDAGAVERIKTDIANLSNNPQKIDPPHLLFPHEEKVGTNGSSRSSCPPVRRCIRLVAVSFFGVKTATTGSRESTGWPD
jgi:hypothetical protein